MYFDITICPEIEIETILHIDKVFTPTSQDMAYVFKICSLAIRNILKLMKKRNNINKMNFVIHKGVQF